MKMSKKLIIGIGIILASCTSNGLATQKPKDAENRSKPKAASAHNKVKCAYCNSSLGIKKCAKNEQFFSECTTACPQTKDDPIAKCRAAHNNKKAVPPQTHESKANSQSKSQAANAAAQPSKPKLIPPEELPEQYQR